MKIYRWILPFAVLLAAVFWILQESSSVETKRTITKTTKYHPLATGSVDEPKVAELIKKLEEKDRRRLEAEGEWLVKEARRALEAGDKLGFEGFIIDILHRYNGDPNSLLLEFSDVLHHEDPHLRIRMAGNFLLTNLKAAEAVQVLRDIVRSDEPLPYGPERSELLNEEFPASDFRFRAADMLALYRIEEVREDVWNLYQKTKDKGLVRPLRRLNEPNMINELKAEAVKRVGSIENMKLIGEYRYEEALPELKRRYDDKSLSADMRFRTLFPLWRITGEEKYFNEFAASFLPSTIPVPYLAIGGEREQQYLIEMLNTTQSNTLIEAVMALHLRFHDDEPIKKMLIGYYHDLSNSNWKDGILARRLVGSINDPELTRVANEYELKYQTGFHDRYAVYRKEWRYPEWEEPLFMD
jgi:hypothetical protein